MGRGAGKPLPFVKTQEWGKMSVSFREVIPSPDRGDTLSVCGLYSLKTVLKSIAIRLIILCQWCLHSNFRGGLVLESL